MGRAGIAGTEDFVAGIFEDLGRGRLANCWVDCTETQLYYDAIPFTRGFARQNTYFEWFLVVRFYLE